VSDELVRILAVLQLEWTAAARLLSTEPGDEHE
jgi:hypothetical protein